MATSGCNSFFEKCDQAFNPHIPNLHPAEVMKRLDRNMYIGGAGAVLFGALLVVSAIIGHLGIVEGIAIMGLGLSGGMAAASYFKRNNYSIAIKRTNFDLKGLDTQYRFADIFKDLGVLFLGHRAFVPIIMPMPESAPQNEPSRS